MLPTISHSEYSSKTLWRPTPSNSMTAVRETYTSAENYCLWIEIDLPDPECLSPTASNSTQPIQKHPSDCTGLTHLASEELTSLSREYGNELCLTSLLSLSHHPEAALLLEWWLDPTSDKDWRGWGAVWETSCMYSGRARKLGCRFKAGAWVWLCSELHRVTRS